MKISVITVCRNAAGTIGQTIASVLSQDYPELEYIIVDGMSTDGTMDIVNSHRERITKIIHEPDSGIADAMNKGIAAATGDWLLFLHADDYLISPDRLSMAAAELDPDVPLHAFPVYYDKSGKKQLHHSRPWGLRLRWKTNIWHQGLLARRDLFGGNGRFNTDYSIAMDYDWVFRMYLAGCSVAVHAQPLSVMRDTGISSSKDWPVQLRRFQEEHRIHLAYAPDKFVRLLYQLAWLLYLPYRRLRNIF